MGPLSGKLQMKMMLDQKKAQADEARKQELQEIKIQEASAKANQALQYKARDQAIKEAQNLSDAGIKRPIPPLSLRQDESMEIPDGDDQIAMLDGKTPIGVKSGEAIIPEATAQDPKYKPLIAKMVAEGSGGTPEIPPPGYSKGTVKIGKVPQRQMMSTSDLLPTIPTVGSRSRRMKGYSEGTTSAGYDNEAQMRVSAKIDPNQNIGWTAEDEARVRAEDAKELAREIERASSAEFAGKDKPSTSFGWTAGDSPKSVLQDYASGVGQVQPEGSWGEVPPVNPLVGTTGRASVMRAIAPVPALQDTNDRASVMRAIEVPRVSVSSIEQERQANAGAPLKPLIVSDVNEGRIPMAPSEADTSSYDETNRLLARHAQENAPAIAAAVEQAKQIPDPGKQKSFLESTISGLFGETGLFTPRDLARFAVVSAGGMLTGGSVGGSLRYAGLDTLKQVDEREAHDYAMKALNNKAIAESGLAGAKAREALKGKDFFVLSKDAPRIMTIQAGSGSATGHPLEVYEMRNEATGQTKDVIKLPNGKLVDRAEYFKLNSGGNPNAAFVPYTGNTSKEGLTEEVTKTSSRLATIGKDIVELRLPKNKDGQSGASKLPAPTQMSTQVAKWLSKTGINLSDSSNQLEAENIMSNATEAMIRDHRADPTKDIANITSYLDDARIKFLAGNLDESLFMAGNKPMSPLKTAELFDKMKRKVTKEGMSQIEIDKAAAAELSTAAKAWRSGKMDPIVAKYAKDSKNSSAFYNWLVDSTSK